MDQLWKARNGVIFSNVTLDPSAFVQKVDNSVHEQRTAAQRPAPDELPATKSKGPRLGLSSGTCVLVDASFARGEAGFGVFYL